MLPAGQRQSAPAQRQLVCFGRGTTDKPWLSRRREYLGTSSPAAKTATQSTLSIDTDGRNDKPTSAPWLHVAGRPQTPGHSAGLPSIRPRSLEICTAGLECLHGTSHALGCHTHTSNGSRALLQVPLPSLHHTPQLLTTVPLFSLPPSYGPPRSSSDESRAGSVSRRRRSSRVDVDDVVVCMVGLHANRNAGVAASGVYTQSCPSYRCLSSLEASCEIDGAWPRRSTCIQRPPLHPPSRPVIGRRDLNNLRRAGRSHGGEEAYAGQGVVVCLVVGPIVDGWAVKLLLMLPSRRRWWVVLLCWLK